MNKATFIFIFIGIIFATNLVQSMDRIGGGDHDVIAARLNEMKTTLESETLEKLKQEALKMEAYINNKSGRMIVGGLHDYIESIEKQELIQIMSMMLLNNVELLDINVYQSVVSPSEDTLGFLEVEQPAKFGGLHDYIYTIDEATLRKWSLATERYIYETTGSTLIGGGIHDRIATMKKPEFIEYLLNIITQYPILDSSVKLNKLCIAYGFSEESKFEEPLIVGGLVDYIWRQSDDVLRQWALTSDKYDKEKRNIKLYGGLEDYINILTREQLMDIILTHAKTYSELNSYASLNQLAQTYGFLLPEEKKVDEPEMVGGLEDYIWRENEDVLRQWALTCERYEKENKDITLIGGLVNYVRLLKKEELIKIVLNYAKKYPELNSNVKLNGLAVSYGISTPEEFPGKNSNDKAQIVGGLVDYIWRETEDVLRQWALTCERYEKERLNVSLIGGLVNYVRLLKKEDLIKLILDYSKKYPELNSNVKLNQLALSYGISQPEELPATKQEGAPQIVGGLVDYIWRMPEETLNQWALTCEKYDHLSRKIDLDGGLHDYISRLSKQQLMNIILDFAKTYPELNSGVKLTQLSISYGFTPNSPTQTPPETIIVGGLHDYIWRVKTDVLFSWAVTCDKYDRNMRNVNMKGGLIDYVRLLGREQLINIILDFAKQYPELNSSAKLQELATTYGIAVDEN